MTIAQDVSDEVWDGLLAYQGEVFATRLGELNSLAHFTSFAALKGIVENNEIWFCPISGMNDWDEIDRGKRFLERMTQDGGALLPCIEKIRGIDPTLWDEINSEYIGRKAPDIFESFSTCWMASDLGTRSFDDLTMWRGYGADGDGVALVIDPHHLGLDADFRSEILICPVFYETEMAFAERSCRAFELFASKLSSIDGALLQELRYLVRAAFAELCFYLAVTHKHPGFSAEREWRFVWLRHRDNENVLSQNVRAEVSARGMYERMCLPLRANPKIAQSPLDLRQMLKAVMVGPCDDAFLKTKAVTRLLEVNGFDLGSTAVLASDIPYRSTR